MASEDGDRIYQPQVGELQLTVRAVIIGCGVGVLVAAMNLTIGLKTGLTIGGSLIAAILAYAVFAMLRPTRAFTVLETNIAQTAGSAAGSMASAAGLVAPIPALAMIDGGARLSYVELTCWALAVGYLGVFFAVPLRRQLIVIEKLRFPSGIVTAETIVSIFAEGAEAVRKARALLIWGIIAALFTLGTFHWTAGYAGASIIHPSLNWLGPVGAFATLWGFTLVISPTLTGVGLLVGPRIGCSMLAGAIIGWLVLGYGVIAPNEWVQGPLDSFREIRSYKTGVRGWILWPGVAVMVADGLMTLGLSWRSIIGAFRPIRRNTADAAESAEVESERVPHSWWLIGLAIGAMATVLVAWLVFDIPPWMTVLAVAVSAFLTVIAVRTAGETDVNPAGSMGKVTQLVFGGVAPGQMTTNLMAAGVATAGASQASDMMADLKTGRLLGASPRRQVIAQCFGIAAGILAVVPIYVLFQHVHDIGGADSEYPAPSARAWTAMAELLSGGFEAMPAYAGWGVLGGVILGALLSILRRSFRSIAGYVPSGLAFGLGFILSPSTPIAIFIGSMIFVIWRRLGRRSHEALVFAVAAGLIAGAALTGVFTDLFDLIRSIVLESR